MHHNRRTTKGKPQHGLLQRRRNIAIGKIIYLILEGRVGLCFEQEIEIQLRTKNGKYHRPKEMIFDHKLNILMPKAKVSPKNKRLAKSKKGCMELELSKAISRISVNQINFEKNKIFRIRFEYNDNSYRIVSLDKCGISKIDLFRVAPPIDAVALSGKVAPLVLMKAHEKFYQANLDDADNTKQNKTDLFIEKKKSLGKLLVPKKDLEDFLKKFIHEYDNAPSQIVCERAARAKFSKNKITRDDVRKIIKNICGDLPPGPRKHKKM